jgi:hypothetical protein
MKVFPTMPPGRRPSLILLFILGLLIITISIRSFTRPTDTNPTTSQPIIDYHLIFVQMQQGSTISFKYKAFQLGEKRSL